MEEPTKQFSTEELPARLENQFWSSWGGSDKEVAEPGHTQN